MDGDFKAYDAQGWPLCDFCPTRAVSAEALLRTPTGNHPPVGRCRDHQRTSLAAGYVTSTITTAMRRTPAPQPRRASKHVSARYTADCPTCGAEGATIDDDPATDSPLRPGEPCRSLRTGRVTDTHRARIDAQYAR